MKQWKLVRHFMTAYCMAVILATANFLLLDPLSASAASLSQSSIRLNRMATATGTTFRLIFKTSGTITGSSLTINFNGADTTTWQSGSGSVAASEAVSNTTCATDLAGTAFPGTPSGTGSGATITFTGITTWATSTVYCEDFTSSTAATTPTAAGTYHPVITAGSDSITVAVGVVASDSILVTAVVPPTFTVSFGGNADTFTSNLVSGAVTSTNGVTVSITTNAKNGWVAWAKDSNTGLASVVASKTIASTTPGTAATLSGSAEGYVIGVTSVTQGTGSAGTTAPATAYDATASGGSNFNGSGLDGTLRQIAASSGTSGTGAGFTVKERTAILATTPAAGDYTDTVTIVSAGKF